MRPFFTAESYVKYEASMGIEGEIVAVRTETTFVCKEEKKGGNGKRGRGKRTQYRTVGLVERSSLIHPLFALSAIAPSRSTDLLT